VPGEVRPVPPELGTKVADNAAAVKALLAVMAFVAVVAVTAVVAVAALPVTEIGHVPVAPWPSALAPSDTIVGIATLMMRWPPKLRLPVMVVWPSELTLVVSALAISVSVPLPHVVVIGLLDITGLVVTGSPYTPLPFLGIVFFPYLVQVIN
jgi:hypothetical protein